MSGNGNIYAVSLAGCTALYAGGNVTIRESGEITVRSISASYSDYIRSTAIRSDTDVRIDIGDYAVVEGYSGIIAKEADVYVSDYAQIVARGWLAYVEGELFGNAIMAKNVTVQDNTQVSAHN